MLTWNDGSVTARWRPAEGDHITVVTGFDPSTIRQEIHRWTSEMESDGWHRTGSSENVTYFERPPKARHSDG